MRKIYDLTPLSPDWGLGYRLIEILGQTLSLIIVAPIYFLFVKPASYIIDKVFLRQ